MKVLHIIDTLWLGGAQSVVKTYFEKQKENPDIFLYVLRQSEPQISIRHKNVRVHSSSSRYSFSPLKEIKDLVKRNSIDVLHCHLPRSQVFGYLLKRFYFPEIKLVFHEQGIIYDYPVILPFLFNLFKSRVNAFIVCSEDNKSALLQKVTNIEKKTFYLPNFVNTDIRLAVKQADKVGYRKELSIKENDFVIGFAGRIVERKGWIELIDAAKILKNKNDIHWLISGIGPEEEKMVEMIKGSGLSSKVTYVGYVPDMVNFYATIDSLVLPSHWEGMSLSQQEAIAVGLSVIVSENVGNTSQGYFATFKNKNPQDLAAKVLELKLKMETDQFKPNEELYKLVENNAQLFMAGLEQVYKSI